ncbi:tRNA (adenosine(37)-N6)-threonylcarbamoyltransferase complex ATPase subunit type 1 TsaE [Alginatibacterium sediminis]|uniref:tRNA threonylcarbamoyladenosine biosynthesis protein TsaE n=1 Tax=Alginatibacterium sediminis TaxID=2164068 RepID=A0A420E7M5_9ALTE|nr:tRNA (adenosine(37)-N6)-threonylcarbamoyltransferase complex ATPase subunit type 1 TsaE [Alginatibacterium sediminis]RKF14522.1 tRNA (adenosine(37)-N6)-threonylcarbamoyltransferase complex ATPase subunit type 1 TsaE [Alginatibacterium sediminis]
MRTEYFLKDADETVAFGKIIASVCQRACTIYLHGDLGSGKTTLTRGIVQGKGHVGHVKSPTYTLVEPYQLSNWQVNHFDLYRLADPEELEFIGIRDYFGEQQLNIVEWPERGQGILPTADLEIELIYVEEQRRLEIWANTDVGKEILSKMSKLDV